VGNEERLFAAVRERLGASRLFTIGIGSAPNGHFMREAARLGRGSFTYIGSPAEVHDRVASLLRKLEAPALTDLTLELPAGAHAALLPERLPDLYVGEPVVVALKARALPPLVTLRGTWGGAPWRHDVALQGADAAAGLGAHWGRAQIAALLDRRHLGAPETDVRAAVTAVALAHHLVSPYTSLVAVDVTPARPGDEPLLAHALKTNLPHGWDYHAVFGLGQGATAGLLHLAVAAVALLLAAALALARRPARP
jgi:Ca-activated chloride channel family protein